jgi:hypothetical protein
MSRVLRILAIVGLIVGGVLGMAGSMVTGEHVRAVCWAIDSTGVIVATAILALAYARSGRLDIAAGFLVYAMGESVILSVTTTSLEAGVPAFAAGTALWSAGLTLTSVPREFATWTRLTGLAAAILLGIVSLMIFAGQPLTAISRPLPFFAYPFMVLTFVGWIIVISRFRDASDRAAGARAADQVVGR